MGNACDIGLRHMKKSELVDKDAEAKFFYRKGYANLERGFYEDSVEALKKADAIIPGDKQVRQALNQANEHLKADRIKAKMVWQDKFLSEEQKICQGPWWQPATIFARNRAWRRDFAAAVHNR